MPKKSKISIEDLKRFCKEMNEQLVIIPNNRVIYFMDGERHEYIKPEALKKAIKNMNNGNK